MTTPAASPSPAPEVFRLRIDADAAIDGTGMITAPASMLVEVHQDREVLDGTPAGRVKLLALDHPQRMDNNPIAKDALFADRRGCVLIPGLVNAHTHLDLTHIGPQPHDKSKGFTAFIGTVLGKRLTDPTQIRQSVKQGIELSLKGGVVAVGDIGGVADRKPCLAPYEALAASAMNGVSFLEFFAIGPEEDARLALLEQVLATHRKVAPSPGVRLGISPHAPYTVSLRSYQGAERIAAAFADSFGPLPLCTHLAETPEEREFIAKGTGPFREFLERFGMWDEGVAATVGQGSTPVHHMADRLRAAPYLLAHVNELSSTDQRMLANTRTSIAYCPRASAYFGAPDHFGYHRYNDLQVANVCVALGTDSVINLPPNSVNGKNGRLSTLDDARLLFQRDEADPRLLLAMCTMNGAKALGLAKELFMFPSSGTWGTAGGQELAGIVSVAAPGKANPYFRLMSCDTPPDLLVLGRAAFAGGNSDPKGGVA